MRTQVIGFVRLTGLVLACMAALACAESAVFQFHPDEGAVYRVRTTRQVLSTTTAGAARRFERGETVARIEVTRPDATRWAFVLTFEKLELYRGERRSMKVPGLAPFIGTPLTMEVWDDGTFGALKGAEAIERKLMAAAGRSGEPPVLGTAFTRLMEEAFKEEFAMLVAPQIGREEAAVGDRWEQWLEGRLPTGGALTMTREFSFEGWEQCGPVRCARLAYTDRGGGTEWSGALDWAINDFARSLCPKAGRLDVLDVSLSGEGERLVEPSTLFTYRQKAEQRLELRVRLDGGEERDVSRVVTTTLETVRLNREEV